MDTKSYEACTYKGRREFLGAPFDVRILDVDAAGLAVIVLQAQAQSQLLKFTRVFTSSELQAAGVRKSLEGFATLVDSLELVEDGFWTGGDAQAAGLGELAAYQLSSSLPGIRNPPPIVSAHAAHAYLTRAPVGLTAWNDSALPGEHKLLLDVVASGLAELCRHKPAGLDAVAWLGRWLLEHNPAQPQVQVDGP